MALPRKLKNMNVFGDGRSFLGEAKSVTLPKLSRKMEEWRGGGMDGAIEIDLGQEVITLEHAYGGLMVDLVRGYGAQRHDGKMIRFAGAYQRDSTGQVDAVEVVVRGRHKEIDFGDAKPGEDTEHKFTTTCSYYKLTVNGRTEVEIDVANMIFRVDGRDLLADQRSAIGA